MKELIYGQLCLQAIIIVIKLGKLADANGQPSLASVKFQRYIYVQTSGAIPSE